MNSRICVRLMVLTLAAFYFVPLRAQDLKTDPTEAEEQEEMSVTSEVEQVSILFEQERKSFLTLLNSEIQPKLPSKDVERLHRSVQRLGSYRVDWARSALEFLIANAPVAELILYRYSTLKNVRLNDRILDTFLSFENFRYPSASLAFSESLGNALRLKIKTLQLLERNLLQDPQFVSDALRLMQSDWAQEIPVQYKLRMIQRSCGAWSKVAGQTENMLGLWSIDTTQFWNRVLSKEVSSCLKSL